MKIPALGLAAVVAATSLLSVATAMVLSETRVERQQLQLDEAAAEEKRAQQQLSVLRQDLDRERAESRRLRDQISSLERDVVKLRALASFNPEEREPETPASSAVVARASTPDALPGVEPTSLQALRSGASGFDAAPNPTDNDGGRVSALSRALGLGADQEAFYRELISDYENRVDTLYDRVAEGYDFSGGVDPFVFQEMLVEILDEKAELDALLDEEFSRTLSEDQTARYLALPTEERGVGPDAGIDRLELQILDLPFILSSESGTESVF
jgi:hypothetical protein